MQPLDVAVFGPMKKKWKTALRIWKEEGLATGNVYATIPKKVGTGTGIENFLTILLEPFIITGSNFMEQWHEILKKIFISQLKPYGWPTLELGIYFFSYWEMFKLLVFAILIRSKGFC